MSTSSDLKIDGALSDTLALFEDGLAKGVFSGQHLSDHLADDLYKSSSLLQKVILYLPQDSLKITPIWDLNDTTVSTDDITSYLNNIEILGSQKQASNIFELIQEASINARLYGDAFIILKIDDGLLPSEPVDLNIIKTIEWAGLKQKESVTYDSQKHCFNVTYTILDQNEYKHKNLPTVKSEAYHESRVLRFVGSPLYGHSFINNNHMNQSVFTALLHDFTVFKESLSATAHMVKTHQTTIFKVPNIANWLAREGSGGIYNRIKTIMRSMDVLGAWFIDKAEEVQTVSHNYGSLDKLLEVFLTILVGSTGMTKSKLLGSSNGSALSSQSEGDRFEWAACVQGYQINYLRPQLNYLTRLVMLAKDSPFKGALLPQWEIEFPSIFEMSPTEDIDYRNKAIDYVAKLINNGVITKKEARESLLGGIKFGIEIILDDADWNAVQAQVEQERVNSQAMVKSPVAP